MTQDSDNSTATPKAYTSQPKATEQASSPSDGGQTPVIAANRRGNLFLILAGVVIVGGLIWAVFHFMYAAKFVETDNAYVAASTAVITPQTSGTVAAVNVGETQAVKAGEVLVVIDNKDAQLAFIQAQAFLDQTLRQVNTYYAQDAVLKARMESAGGQIIAAESAVNEAQKAFNDRNALSGSGAVSAEEVTAAKSSLDKATAALNSARAEYQASEAQRAANAMMIARTDLQNNPQVIAAKVKVEQAKLELERTEIRAPISGIVVQKNIDVGQRLAAGTPIMNIVPLDDAYVYANLKEVQLKDVKDGQEVELFSDTYGKKVVFHGTVTGIAGGTGSAFSVIPAQNATGNWIKVVQRIPVKIKLDTKELKAHPLRVGMSMQAKIHVAK